MKVSLLKIARKKEVIKRVELEDLAEMIRRNPEEDKVFPCWEHPLKCHRNDSKVPSERLEGAIRTTRKWWSNKLYGLQG